MVHANDDQQFDGLATQQESDKMKNTVIDTSNVQPNEKPQSAIVSVLDERPNDTHPQHSQANRLEWAKSQTHILRPTANEDRQPGVIFQNLSVYGSPSSIQVQQTVLSSLIKPLVNVARLLGHKKGHEARREILHKIDGLLSSGELLLVLGRPGSGCSTFLKAISGHLDGLTLDPASNIQHNGRTLLTRKHNGEAVYNDEEDYHFPHLTVAETLEFAACARAPRHGVSGISRDEYVKVAVNIVMSLLGLSHTAHTQVGSEYVRGVSGGERKRVSIAEMMLARAPIGTWDNSTRGLDANSALEFVQSLRLLASVTKSCHAATVYQASEQIYGTFDNVTVLYEGRQIYFGPCSEAVGYFENMGWQRHPSQVSADFLTAVTNPTEREPREGMADKVPRTPDEFEVYWRQSLNYRALQDRMNQYQQGPDIAATSESTTGDKEASHIQTSSHYLLPVSRQTQLCITRAYRRSRNDLSGLIATAVVQIVIAVLIGSLFYNIEDSSVGLTQRASVIFLAVLTNNLIALLEINVLYSHRPIIEKQARYAFVRPFTESLAGVIVDLPVKLLRCLLASVVIYFLANLRREADHFFIYILFQLVSVVAMSGLFRCLATMTKTLGQAMALGGIVIICIAVYTGFTIPQADMRPWLGWIRWINPIFYTFEAILANEFHDLRSACTDYIPMYQSLQGSEFTCSVIGAIAGEHFVSGDRYIEKNYGYSYSHLWRNLGILLGFLAAFHIVYLVLAEWVPGTVTVPKTLIYLVGKVPRQTTSNDVEAVKENATLGVLQKSDTRSRLIAQEQANVFSWKGLCYDVPIKGGTKRLLQDVSGWVKPGTLTALMGVSGAGKTTLLNVLAQRMTVGVVTGDVLVNGHTLSHNFNRHTGYVEQHDIHLETCTIREALRFSAALRQPRSVSTEQKYAYVEEVIQVLGMQDFAETVIGNPGEGLNMEQRKLLSIGVELAAKPQLLIFLDEPTSGLDSHTSFAICSFMRKIANHGQAVLATIHQPGAVMFEQFDRLLLLAKGGRMVYFGDIGSHSRTVLDYFESNGARPCHLTENPAEYLLQLAGDNSETGHSHIDWVNVWQQSPQHQEVLDHLDDIATNSPRTAVGDNSNDMARLSTQLQQVIKRDFQQSYRQPEYIIAKLALGIVSGLFVGFSFWMSDYSQQGFQNTLFSLFLLCTIFSTMVNQIMPKFIGRRTLYELREGPSQTYSWQVFIFSQILVELPWQAFLGVCTWASFYFSVYGAAQESQRQGLVLLFVVQFFLYASSFAYFVAAAVPNAVLGSMLALFMFVMSLLSNGVMQPPKTLPPFWNYMHRVSPLTYYVGGISATALHGREIHCSERERLTFNAPAGQTCSQYMEEYLKTAAGTLINGSATGQCHYCPLSSADQYLANRDIFWHLRWRDYGILWAYFAFNILGAILLYYLFRVLPLSRRNKKV